MNIVRLFASKLFFVFSIISIAVLILCAKQACTILIDGNLVSIITWKSLVWAISIYVVMAIETLVYYLIKNDYYWNYYFKR